MSIEEHTAAELLTEFNSGIATVISRIDKVEGDLRLVKTRQWRPPGIAEGGNGGEGGESIGALVVKDAKFRDLQAAARGISRVDVNRRLVATKSTITLGPTLRPGVESMPVAQLPGPAPTLAALIPQRGLNEGSLQFVRQKAPHPVAGVQVHQGDTKTEGAFAFETVTLALATLAIWVAASRQVLRDVAGLSLVIDNELLYAIRVLEEQEILYGDGSEGHLLGILPQATALAATAGDTPLDAVARAIGALAAAGVPATGVVMNPSDWLAVTLSKNDTSDYLLGSPATATAFMVWGVPLALSVAIAPGTILAGNFSVGAELAYRELAMIDISTEHADFFVRNLICVRAEESLALAVKQPSCFIKTTLPASVARNGAPPKVK